MGDAAAVLHAGLQPAKGSVAVVTIPVRKEAGQVQGQLCPPGNMFCGRTVRTLEV